jgi:Uma2 family endonuclease
MAISLNKRLFDIQSYHRLTEAGILGEDERVELIHGEIIEMSPVGSQRAGLVKKIRTLLGEQIGKRAMLGVQDPIILDEHSEPEPDIAILKYREDFYTSDHPRPEDVLLLIEVADTSLEVDREVKMPLYAAAGIPAYWIINLRDQQVEAYFAPQGSLYKQRIIATPQDTLSLPSLQLQIKTGEWLNP